jgi:hypothetical protein
MLEALQQDRLEGTVPPSKPGMAPKDFKETSTTEACLVLTHSPRRMHSTAGIGPPHDKAAEYRAGDAGDAVTSCCSGSQQRT